MYKCPKCGNEDGFDVFVDSPIWVINKYGDISDTYTHFPDGFNTTMCPDCGYTADLCEFDSSNFEADEE